MKGRGARAVRVFRPHPVVELTHRAAGATRTVVGGDRNAPVLGAGLRRVMGRAGPVRPPAERRSVPSRAMESHPDVDAYLRAAELWPEELARLRPVLLDAGLEETIKWGKPCYVHDGANICIAQEMKDFLALMFFKGALLSDPDGVLESQGANTRSARRVVFRSVDDVDRLAETVAALVDEAVAVEEAGLSVEPPADEPLAEELQARLDADPALAEAFAALTPGRRRQYDLYVSDAKQASTRESRVERCVPTILAGRGLRDR